MTDVLIRNIPEDVLSRIDERAARLGLSRNEYLRRRIEQEDTDRDRVVTVDDLKRASDLTRDLLDEDVMRDAWS
ncbi:MAG TPA: ribbon-helix-helix protein, CopG family [Segeticoccus sp.]|nr:ribbon-helix-helix protein, CopG family [Segeticoccus sp.]